MLGWFTAVEQALSPDFDSDHNGPELKRAFVLLLRAMIVFALAVAVWSFAAGTLDAGRWVGRGLPAAALLDRWNWCPIWLLALVGAVAIGLKLFGALSLMTMAAGLVGGLLGFLFGLPSHSGQTAPAAATGNGQASAPGAGRWLPNTNLIQITDWLTKTIVGVSLVEAKGAYTRFGSLCDTASQNLLGGAFGSEAVVGAALIGGGVLGFKLCNLYTLLFLARLIAKAGTDVTLTVEQKQAVGELGAVSSDDAAIAEPIELTEESRRFTGPSPQAMTPTGEQAAAAVEIGRQPLANLSTYDTVLAWARGRAMLNDYPAAAEGYRKLIPLMQPPNASVLAEAARVYAKVGAYAESKSALAKALTLPEMQTPDKRVTAVRDYVVMLLYDPKPQGYTQALKLLDDAVVNADSSGELALLRACANGQRYADNPALPENERTQLRDSVVADVKTALARGQDKAWIRRLSDPNAPGKPPPGSPAREDDLEALYDDPAFRALLADAPAAPPAA